MYIVASVDTFAIVSFVLFVSAFATDNTFAIVLFVLFVLFVSALDTNNTVDIVDTNIIQIALWTQ